MNLKSIKEFSNDDMSVEVEEAIVIFRLQNDVFNLMADRDKSRTLF